MKNIKRKTICVLTAIAMLGSVATLTVFAEPTDAGDVPAVDVPVDDTPAVDVPVDDTPSVDIPVDDTPVEDIPVQDDVNTDDGGSSSGGYIPDNNTDSNTGSDVTDNSNTDVNYDADYYYDMYNNGDYGTVYEEPQVTYDYDPGMTFDEFERATDYQSATADTESMVDMYNSNGSDSVTLSESDWADISLNLDKASADGTDDFSFIKDNNSDKDSNVSVLFLIFGIIFVASALTMITYLIVSGVRNRRLANDTDTNKTSGKRGKGKHHYASHSNADNHSTDNRYTHHETERTRFNYDTAEIDISSYDDEY